VENSGQWNREILWLAPDAPLSVRGLKGGVAFSLASQRSESPQSDAVANLALEFEGAAPDARMELLDPVADTTHYFLGNLPNDWRPSTTTYRSARILDLYPGIDLRVHFDKGAFEYDLVCRSAKCLSDVVMRIDGATSIDVDASGDLSVEIGGSVIRQSIPKCTSIDERGVERAVECRFVILSPTQVGFALPGDVGNGSVVVDPSITFSTFCGNGGGYIPGISAAMNKPGETVFTSSTSIASFPTTPGAYDTTYNDSGPPFGDVWVMKFDPTGSSLVYSTFLGGNNLDDLAKIAIDQAGNAYLCGETKSTNFPTTGGSPWPGSIYACYIAKLNSTGSALLYSAFTGGFHTAPSGIAADDQGNAYATGIAWTSGLYTTPGALQPFGSPDTFITKVDTVNFTLLIGTYFGSGNFCFAAGIAPDPSGAVWVVGDGKWPGMPVTPNAIDPIFGDPSDPSITEDAFLIELNPQGSALLYSTFLGFKGSAAVSTRGGVFVRDPFVYVFGVGSTKLPSTPGCYAPLITPLGETWVLKFHPVSATLIFATYVPVLASALFGIGLDESGNSYFSSTVTFPSTAPYPITADAFKQSKQGNDGHILKLNSTGTGILFGSYFGGTSDEWFGPCAGVGSDSCIVLGSSNSIDFPTTQGVYDSSNPNQYTKNTLTRLDLPADPFGVVPFGSGTPGCAGPHKFTVNEPAQVGATNFQFLSDNAPANSLGLALVCDQPDFTGSDPLGLGVVFHIGLLAPTLFGVDMNSDNWGTGKSAPLTLPSSPWLVGQTFYSQAFWLWPQGSCAPSPSPFNLSSSNGLALTVIP
jgi:hypothetical protein